MEYYFSWYVFVFKCFVLTQFIYLIPKAALAAILLQVGYKLSKPSIFKAEYKRKLNRFVPFIVTIIAILLTDLLKGVVIGIATGMIFILLSNYQTSISLFKDGDNFLLRFHKDVSFLNKKVLRKLLNEIPSNSKLLIDNTKADFIDTDIVETIDDFIESAPNRDILITVKTSSTKPKSIFKLPNENN